MNLANYITLIRILLAPCFFTALLTYEERGQEIYRYWAVVLFIVGALTDALDGLIARTFKKKTRLGQFLDPLADKLLLLSGFLGLLFVPSLPLRPPLWVTVTIVFRDLLIIGGLIVIFLLSGRVRMEPNRLGKWTTAFQMLTLVSILLVWNVSAVLWNITAFLTILSCLVYIARELKWIRQST